MYRAIWTSVDKTMPATQACKFMVGLLHLAATYDCEAALGQEVLKSIHHKKPLTLKNFEKVFCKKAHRDPPSLTISHLSMKWYDQMIPSSSFSQRCHHVSS